MKFHTMPRLVFDRLRARACRNEAKTQQEVSRARAYIGWLKSALSLWRTCAFGVCCQMLWTMVRCSIVMTKTCHGACAMLTICGPETLNEKRTRTCTCNCTAGNRFLMKVLIITKHLTVAMEPMTQFVSCILNTFPIRMITPIEWVGLRFFSVFVIVIRLYTCPLKPVPIAKHHTRAIVRFCAYVTLCWCVVQ